METNNNKEKREKEEKPERISLLTKWKTKRMVKAQHKLLKIKAKKASEEREEEEKLRETLISCIMEINGTPEKEGILEICDDEGIEVNKALLGTKTTQWLIETWQGALEELAKIVGIKDYEDKIDFKPNHE